MTAWPGTTRARRAQSAGCRKAQGPRTRLRSDRLGAEAGKLMKETEYAALMEKKAQQVTSSSPATTATASSLRTPHPSATQPAAPQSNPAPRPRQWLPLLRLRLRGRSERNCRPGPCAGHEPARFFRSTASGSAGKEAVLEVLGQGMTDTADIVFDLRGLNAPFRF